MVTTQEIKLNYIVKQGEGNIVSDMGGEKVMLSINKGKYYNLGEIGGVIWDLAKEPIVIEELVTHLISHYEVEQGECELQVMNFIKQLNDEGLLIVES